MNSEFSARQHHIVSSTFTSHRSVSIHFSAEPSRGCSACCSSGNLDNHKHQLFFYPRRSCMGPLDMPGDHIDGLMQERRNSIANALELQLSYTNPSICKTQANHTLSCLIK